MYQPLGYPQTQPCPFALFGGKQRFKNLLLVRVWYSRTIVSHVNFYLLAIIQHFKITNQEGLDQADLGVFMKMFIQEHMNPDSMTIR